MVPRSARPQFRERGQLPRTSPEISAVPRTRDTFLIVVPPVTRTFLIVVPHPCVPPPRLQAPLKYSLPLLLLENEYYSFSRSRRGEQGLDTEQRLDIASRECLWT